MEQRRGRRPDGMTLSPHPVTPTSSTYRVQLGPDFDLFAAATLVPYLRKLGVTHLYLSPVLQATPGSAGSDWRNWVNAVRPPADAPTPTTGNRAGFLGGIFILP